MSSWALSSIPLHDWFLCLDIDQYFDHEHDPEKMFEDRFSQCEYSKKLNRIDLKENPSFYFGQDAKEPDEEFE